MRREPVTRWVGRRIARGETRGIAAPAIAATPRGLHAATRRSLALRAVDAVEWLFAGPHDWPIVSWLAQLPMTAKEQADYGNPLCYAYVRVIAHPFYRLYDWIGGVDPLAEWTRFGNVPKRILGMMWAFDRGHRIGRLIDWH